MVGYRCKAEKDRTFITLTPVSFSFLNVDEIKTLPQDTACSKGFKNARCCYYYCCLYFFVVIKLCDLSAMQLEITGPTENNPFVPSFLNEFQALPTSAALMFIIMTMLVIIIC